MRPSAINTSTHILPEPAVPDKIGLQQKCLQLVAFHTAEGYREHTVKLIPEICPQSYPSALHIRTGTQLKVSFMRCCRLNVSEVYRMHHWGFSPSRHQNFGPYLAGRPAECALPDLAGPRLCCLIWRVLASCRPLPDLDAVPQHMRRQLCMAPNLAGVPGPQGMGGLRHSRASVKGAGSNWRAVQLAVRPGARGRTQSSDAHRGLRPSSPAAAQTVCQPLTS